MFSKRMICLVAAIVCCLGLCGGVAALEVDSDAVYCFTAGDFAGDGLQGICITQLPDPEAGTLMLGARVLQPGDILTAQQLEKVTFHPLRSEQDREAVVTFLPIYEDRVATATAVTVLVRGKEDKAPVAEDLAMETYKDLPNQGTLKVTDPEGLAMTFTVTRQPKRGEVTVNTDGTFVYTPRKNKVGVDSFTYTATDPAGNVSREATVTIQILKPADGARYADTEGSDCRFEAEWLKNTGLFVGEQVGGQLCFHGDKPVSREEFLVMMLKALDIPEEKDAQVLQYVQDAPQWLQPYLAAAYRAGILSELPAESGDFTAGAPITGAEAAVMLQSAMELAVTTVVDENDPAVPSWAAVAVTAMWDHGIGLDAMSELTRGEAAKLLYRVSKLAPEAPGLMIYR